MVSLEPDITPILILFAIAMAVVLYNIAKMLYTGKEPDIDYKYKPGGEIWAWVLWTFLNWGKKPKKKSRR